MDSFDINAHYRLLTKQLLARDNAASAVVNHDTYLGDSSEAILRDFIHSILSRDYRVERGQLVLPNGVVSPETDVVVFRDTLGAVVGQTEGGAFLIHAETAKVVIEVKRSLAADQIERIQNHAGKLYDAFQKGNKQEIWCQWAFAFRSPSRSHDSILIKLNETYHPARSTGLLVVLDAHISAEDRDSQIDACITRDPMKENEVVDRKQLKQLLADAAEPHSCLFGRIPTEGKYISQADKSIPPLLEFVTHLCNAIDINFKDRITNIGRFSAKK